MHTTFQPAETTDRASVLVSAIYAVAALTRARTPEGLGQPCLSGAVTPFDTQYRVSVQVAYGASVRSYLSEEVLHLSDAPAATERLLEASLGAVACDLSRALGGGVLLSQPTRTG